MLTGAINNGGHAWNAVKLDGKWYTIDATNNNKKGNSIPYWIVNTSYEFAQGTTLVLDDGFIDGKLTSANNPLNTAIEDSSHDWYIKNNMYANNINELAKIIKNHYNGQDVVYIKCGPGVVLTNQQEIDNLGRELVNEGMDINTLQSLRIAEVSYGVRAVFPAGYTSK